MTNAATLSIAIEVDDRGSIKIRNIGKASEEAGEKSERGFSRVRKSINDLDRSSKVTIGSIGKIGAAATAMAGAAVAGVTAVMARAVKSASDLAEVTSKFNVVFAGQQEQANAWADELTRSYAMSTREARQYLASVQDLLVPMGMQADAAGRMSSEIVKLSADLGSFNNLPTAQVMEDIQSALVGNYETMKKYGVVVTATTVQEKALAMGLADTKKELTAAHKAQAAYQLIVEGSAAAIGDMARTADGYANQMKQFSAHIEDLTAGLGKRLLPVAADVLSRMNKSLGGSADGVDRLAESLSVGLLKILGHVIEAMRFFHNGWLGIKLVGQLAVQAVALGMANLYKVIRKVIFAWDLLFKAAVKLGAIKVNPFDKVEAALDLFKKSSADVTRSVLRDIAETNARYDKISKTIKGYVNVVIESGQAHRETAGQAQIAGLAAAEAAMRTRDMAIEAEEATESVALLWDEFERGNKVSAAVDSDLASFFGDLDSMTEAAAAKMNKTVDDSLDEFFGDIDNAHTMAEESTFDMTKYMEERWKEAYDGMQNVLADWIKTGELNFESLLDMFKNMLAEMVAAWVMNKGKMVIADLFDGGGFSWGSGGSSGGGSALSLLSSAYEMYSGESVTSSAGSWLAGLFGTGGAGAAYAGTGSAAAAGAGIYPAVGVATSGTGYAVGMGGTAAAGAGTAGTATAGGGAAAAGGGSLAAVGAVALPAAVVAGLGYSLYKSLTYEHPEPWVDLMNKQGLGPEAFVGAIGDKFMKGMDPIYGGLVNQMYDTSSKILTIWDDTNGDMVKYTAWAGDHWESIGAGATVLFQSLSKSMDEDLAAAMVEAQYGIAGLGEEILSATDQMKDGLDLASDALEEAGLSGVELSYAMDLAATSTEDLEQYLNKMGIAADVTADVMDNVADAYKNGAVKVYDAMTGMMVSVYDGVDYTSTAITELMKHVSQTAGNASANTSVNDPTPPPPPATPPSPPKIPIPTPPPPVPFAVGGVVSAPTFGVFGEAGTEAIVPLHDGPATLRKMHDDIRRSGGPREIILNINIDGNELINTKNMRAAIRIEADELIVTREERGLTTERVYM